jgi:uncharacterized protein (UPF0261 family)
MKAMAKGVAVITLKLFDQGKLDAVLGLGGTGSTSIVTAAMKELPVGVPKIMVSTVASGDTSFYVGLKDITMIPSIVDVAGLNKISNTIFTRAAGAVCGMLALEPPDATDDKPIITATMFGQTTPCVGRCRDILEEEGFEVLTFHASGKGGMTMEQMINEGYVSGVLDITTTEWSDELNGGILNAGPERLEAPGNAGIPHLIVPGCIDMVNFGPPESVPEKYKARNLYQSKPTTTLMRTTAEENRELGRIFAKKANGNVGNTAFLIPMKGFSQLDTEGQPFWLPEADSAFIETLKKHLDKDIPVVELNAHINDKEFSEKAVEMLLSMMRR